MAFTPTKHKMMQDYVVKDSFFTAAIIMSSEICNYQQSQNSAIKKMQDYVAKDSFFTAAIIMSSEICKYQRSQYSAIGEKIITYSSKSVEMARY
jgi:hypothetical protein